MNPVIASITQACLPVTGLTVARNRSIDLCILYMNRIEFLIIAVDSQNVVYLIRVIICFLSIECPPCVEFRSIVKKSLIEGKMEFTIEIFCGDLDRQRTNVSLERHDRHKRSIDHRVKLLIIVHCYPARIFWTRFSFTGFVHARTRRFDVCNESGNISSRQRKIYSMGNSK